MVHATWDDWFVRDEVEATEPAGLSVWYLGCNGFVCRTATTTVYIDPYFGDGDPPALVRMVPVPMNPADATRCDAVLATHEHIDHMHPPSYGPLVDRGATVYAPSAAFTDLDYDGDLAVDDDQRVTVTEGDSYEVGDLTIHVRGAFDPDSLEPVSYVVEHETGVFFHGGDSKPAEDFSAVGEEFDIDLGALAFGTVGVIYDAERGAARPTRWYMDENQIVEAANDLQLHRLLPTHYDMWRGGVGDPKVLHEHAATHPFPAVVEVARIGDRLDVDRPGVVQSRDLQ